MYVNVRKCRGLRGDAWAIGQLGSYRPAKGQVEGKL